MAKDEINARVKKREHFRPYAPSVLREACSEWFDLDESPYMLLEALVHPHKASQVAGIVHADGTSRPQTVSKDSNPRYCKLIAAVHKHIGIPMVLNTSFNLHGEAIVNRPEHAIYDLLTSDMDALFLDDYFILKKSSFDPKSARERLSSHAKYLNWIATRNSPVPGAFSAYDENGSPIPLNCPPSVFKWLMQSVPFSGKRIGLCGGGRHTADLLELAGQYSSDFLGSVRAIVDDDTDCFCSRKFGIPIYTFDQAVGLTLDYLIISSYDYESTILKRAKACSIDDEKLISLYMNPMYIEYLKR